MFAYFSAYFGILGVYMHANALMIASWKEKSVL